MLWLCQLCGTYNQSQCFPIWQKGSNTPGLCFQQLVIAGTANFLFAVLSAISAGYQHSESIKFHRPKPSRTLTARLCVSVLMILTYIIEGITSVWLVQQHPTVSWSLIVVGAITWASHSVYVWSSRRNMLFRNLHIGLVLTWILTLISCSFQFYTSVKEQSWPGGHSSPEWSNNYGYPHALGVLVRLCLHLCYLPTLLLKVRQPTAGVAKLVGSMADCGNIQEENETERSPLLRRLDRTQYSLCSSDAEIGAEPFVAEEVSNCLSWLFFCWVGDLMLQGSKGLLDKPHRLPLLPKSLRTQQIRQKFSHVFQSIQAKELSKKDIDTTETMEETVKLRNNLEESFESSSGRESPSPSVDGLPEGDHKAKEGNLRWSRQRTLLIALNRTFGWRYYPLGILKLVADLLGFCGPLLLHELVAFMENKSSDMKYGYYYAAGLAMATLLAALISSQFTYLVNRVGVQVRAALITAIYGKALAVNTAAMQEFTTGEVVNFMSTDTDRIVNFCISFHQFWSLPFQVAVALYLLHQQVGIAFLAGVAFAILLIPINRWLAIKIGKLSTTMMEQKDNRVKVMTEVLAGIRVVKFYAWENQFAQNVNHLRSLELKSLKGRKYLDALCVYFWATTPVLIAILTFATYTAISDEKLTAAKVFTSVALFNMLIGPLNAFPWVLNGLVEAWVSLKRVQKFMWLKELDLVDYFVNMPPFTDHSDMGASAMETRETSIQIVLGKFVWPSQEGKRTTRSTLKNINLTVKQGQLVGICGQVGAGKSSLLAAITAEMERTAGRVFVNCLETGFGVAFQEAWIQHATIRDNILCGQPFDQDKYSHVIQACALTEDLSILPSGDQTEVGENGVTLSGGQKARVALARAVYQDKDVYLLDDPLAAVDANVARHLFQECIHGLLKGKTRILCTHHTQFLMNADVVILMDNGRIVDTGSPHEVFSHYAHLLPNPVDDINQVQRMQPGEVQSDSGVEGAKRGISASSEEAGVLVKEEEKEVGAVAIHVYKSYWLAIGNCLATSILVALFLMQASRNLTDWWLSYWVTESETQSSGNLSDKITMSLRVNSNLFPSQNQSSNNIDNDVSFYLTVYGGLAAANSVFTLFRAFLYAYGGILAATVIHKRLLAKVLEAPITFFDITPIGRIVNRFSSDVYTIDDSLPFILNILLAQLFGVLGTIAVTCYGLPWFALALVPLGIIYYFIQRYYRRTSRELKRLSTVTLSPIYAHFSESLTGLATIRAFRQTERFAQENEERLDLNQRANFGGYAAGQWLGIRLQLLGVAMVTAVAFISMLQHNFSSVNPGLVGLALSYALSVTALLSGVITSFTETEKEMVSVERAEQYIRDIPKEHQHPLSVDVAPDWPSEGIVCFQNVSLVYRSGLPSALSGVSFRTRPGEKVGIVGRTGAGKSSLFLCLFQLVRLSEGKVFIDGIDVSTVRHQTLRSKLAVIPQDPFLFNGSVRDNLDPCHRWNDSQLWTTIEKCHLKEIIDSLGGLDEVVGERGRNLSAGQKQLVCLARAMLTKAKVLCIDEATASVDKTTDHQLQQTIRDEFSDSTVLTIAHRIETIVDSDRILCMDQGRVVDFASPRDLQADPNSLFSQLTSNAQ